MSIPAAFHHLGLATRSPRRAEAFLASMGYVGGERARDDLQEVNLALFDHTSMPRVEIVWPTENAGPLEPFLRSTEGLVYHVCYEVDDVEQVLGPARASGAAVRTVSPPTPAVLFGGRKVSFHLVAGVGLIELLERGMPS